MVDILMGRKCQSTLSSYKTMKVVWAISRSMVARIVKWCRVYGLGACAAKEDGGGVLVLSERNEDFEVRGLCHLPRNTGR